MKRISLVLFFILLSMTFGFSKESGPIKALPSLDWQKHNLEKSLRSKISNVLDSILTSNQYTVDIDLKTKDIVDPDWNKTANPVKLKGQAKLGKNATEVDKADSSNNDSQKQPLVKFTEPKPLDNPEDYIVFNKFGLEAPLIDDFNDFRPDGKIILSMDDGSTKEDKKRKVEELRYRRQIKDENERNKSKVSDIERMWKYNNAVDIFKNLESISITLKLSQGLKDSVKQAVEKYVKGINFNLGEIKPKIKFEYVILGNDINAPTTEEKLEKYFKLFAKFATLFGIIIGVILFGIIGNKLISKFFELKGADEGAQSKLINENANDNEEDDAQSEAMAMSSSSEDGPGVKGLNGVDRFKSYSQNSQKDAVLLIKKWLSEDEKKGKQALRAIVQQMDNGDLGSIFTYLSENEKADWRKLLEKPLSAAELSSANDFISNQIVQSIIIPSYIDDPETYDLLLKLKPEQLVEIIKEDPDTSSFLMNALSLNFVNQVLAKCDPQTRSTLIQKSVKVKQKEILEGQDQIKAVLSRYVEEREQSPFVEKITQLIPISSPDFEDTLFQNLGQHSGRDALMEMGRKYFPASEIVELPDSFLKAVLMNYPLAPKSEMLLTVNEELKTHFMDLFAPEGSKARDMLTLEFENIVTNEAEYDKLLERSDEVWKHFVTYVRGQVKKDKTLQHDVGKILNVWADRVVSGTHEEESPGIKLVS